MPAPLHRSKVVATVACAVVTVSDTRTTETDESGKLLQELLNSHGHSIVEYAIVPDDPEQIRGRVAALCARRDVQAVLMTGGTGVSLRDSTPEAINPILEKKLDGFGELFRFLSFQEVGSAAMLSRATAGVVDRTIVFLMPGSPSAVRLAMQRLILPELGHIVSLLAATL